MYLSTFFWLSNLLQIIYNRRQFIYCAIWFRLSVYPIPHVSSVEKGKWKYLLSVSPKLLTMTYFWWIKHLDSILPWKKPSVLSTLPTLRSKINSNLNCLSCRHYTIYIICWPGIDIPIEFRHKYTNLMNQIDTLVLFREEIKRNIWYFQAHSAYHGIGLVKLMGRSSGFIAMQASLSSGQVDVCLIPEVSST